MKAQSINCPNCNSPQKFVVKEKIESDLIIKFVSCLMCREETVIDTYAVNEKKMRQKTSILKFRQTRSEMRLKSAKRSDY